MKNLLLFPMLMFCGVLAAQDFVNVGYFFNKQYYLVNSVPSPTGYLFNPDASKKVTLATLDWPPYIGDELCNKGWVFQLAVAILSQKGYQVEVRFMPWARAVQQVESGKIDILFPEYYIEDTAPSDNFPKKTRRDLLALSNAFPGGEIGFVKRKGDDISYDGNLLSLRGSTIGVVRGYQNTPEFDLMMDNGEFATVEAVDDLQLVRLLKANRVDLIIGDLSVLRFTVNYSNLPIQEKAQLLNSIEPVEPSIQYNPLYFALSKKNQGWKKLMHDINTALYEFEHAGETKRIIDMGSSQCF